MLLVLVIIIAFTGMSLHRFNCLYWCAWVYVLYNQWWRFILKDLNCELQTTNSFHKATVECTLLSFSIYHKQINLMHLPLPIDVRHCKDHVVKWRRWEDLGIAAHHFTRRNRLYWNLFWLFKVFSKSEYESGFLNLLVVVVVTVLQLSCLDY